MGILNWIILGSIAGFIASKFVNKDRLGRSSATWLRELSERSSEASLRALLK
jgi:hypothetical protein